MNRIAIIEDNSTIRSSLSELIESLDDCECVGALASAEEALRLLPKLNPDLVLMDIHLPGMSGIECTARLKDKSPELRVLILTVYEDGAKIFDALKAGASGYILKRSSPDEITSAISEMLAGGAPMTATVALKVVESFRKPQFASDKEMIDLTARESEILQLLVDGQANKEMADRLNVSIETIRWHLKQIYEKLHVRSRTEAAVKFLGMKSDS